jgi:hypothetical protein
MAEAHYRPNTYGYKHKLRICNSYCFTTATTVAQMRLNVVLYIRPSCSNTFMRQLHEVTIFVSSCLSVHLSAWNRATLTRQCLLNLIFVIFAAICQHISALVESNRPLKWTPTYICNILPLSDFTIQADHILCTEHAAAKQTISNQHASTRTHTHTYYTTYPFLRDRTDRLCYIKHRKAHLHHIRVLLENVHEIKIQGR